MTNSIRPIAVASLLAKGEAQKVASVHEGGYERKLMRQVSGNKLRPGTEDSGGWLEIERQEGSATLSRDRWLATKAERRGGVVQYPRRSSRAVSKPDDRAFVVAGKRLTTVERRDAGEMEA
jgi:hypothetical protein